MTLTKVDLPAPLSPTSATTSPGRTSIDAPRSAWTEPNDFLMFRMESSGVPRLPFAAPALTAFAVFWVMMDLSRKCRASGSTPCVDTHALLVGLAHRRLLDALTDLGPGPNAGLHHVAEVVGRDVADGQEDRRHVHELVVHLAVDHV